MRVCIIGAGVSGLVSIKACLEEGLQPVCFEKTDDIGGLWRFRSEDDGQACVMRSTVANTSKEMMALSDFPPDASYPNFMPNSHVRMYLRDYARHFHLAEYIQFRHSVVNVDRRADFAATGQWSVTITDDVAKVTRTETFGAVMVCVGHHSQPHVPTFPGLGSYKGLVFHPHSYRDSTGENFKDKRILVIGIGNSGCDLAVELSHVASQVLLSTRRGTWVFKRISNSGLPSDFVLFRRWFVRLADLLPMSVINAVLRHKLNSMLDHKLYALEPDHEPMSAQPTVNDDLPGRIICGAVRIKANVEMFTPTGCHFVDGTFEDSLDAVIVATGYKLCFPFLPADVVAVDGNRLDLFKYVFPTELAKSTLAFIGYVHPIGAVHPISEGQARWAARVFTGAAQLPSPSDMLGDVEAKREAMARRYVKSTRHTIQVDWIQYMDEVHELFGARPSMAQLWLTDPRLAARVWFGPCLPYHYRLMGPHRWPKAREAILTVWDRVRQPLATRPLSKAASCDGGAAVSLLLLVAVVIVALAALAAVFFQWRRAVVASWDYLSIE